MKKYRFLNIAAAFIGLLLTSACAKTIDFTQELRTSNRLTVDELKMLQYYATTDILLQRTMSSSEREVGSAHKLVMRQGQRIDEVLVEKNTPGIAVDVGSDWLSISFEEGSFFNFGSSNGRTSSGGYCFYTSEKDTKIYENKEYAVIKRGCLKISLDSLSDRIKNRKSLRGRTLD